MRMHLEGETQALALGCRETVSKIRWIYGEEWKPSFDPPGRDPILTPLLQEGAN